MKKHETLIFWIVPVIVAGILMWVSLIPMWIKLAQTNSNDIKLDHVDQYGTIWVEFNVDNQIQQSYLYLDDDGTKKKVEWR